MSPDIETVLQYGAMGLLAMIIVLIGGIAAVVVRNFIDEYKKTNAFLREQTMTSNAHLSSIMSGLQGQISASTSTLKNLCDSIGKHDERSQMNQDKMYGELREISGSISSLRKNPAKEKRNED